MKKEKIDKKMSLSQHLKECRNSLLVMAAVFVAAFLGCYVYAPQIVSAMININPDYTFVQSDVTELLAQYIKVSLLCAVVLDSPVIVWQIHSFVSPGLTRSENVKFLSVLIGGLVFFAVGDVFCYKVVIPFTLQFFLGLNRGLAVSAAITSLINLQNYISYLVALLVAFGCIFEMPVIAAILTSLGLLTPKGMAAARSIVIVLCFVIGAAITPPDIVSQFMVAVPMLLLYQLSIWVSSFFYGKRRKRLAAQGIDPDDGAGKPKKKRNTRWQQAAAQVERRDAEKKKR